MRLRTYQTGGGIDIRQSQVSSRYMEMSTFIYLDPVGELFAVFPNERRLHSVLQIPATKGIKS